MGTNLKYIALHCKGKVSIGSICNVKFVCSIRKQKYENVKKLDYWKEWLGSKLGCDWKEEKSKCKIQVKENLNC